MGLSSEQSKRGSGDQVRRDVEAVVDGDLGLKFVKNDDLHRRDGPLPESYLQQAASCHSGFGPKTSAVS